MKKPAMPSPDVIAAEMTRIVRTAGELADLAQQVGDAYADLYDASFRPSGGTNGFEKPIATGDFRVTDPTGQVALSGTHKKMRWRLHQAARQLRKIGPFLEESSNILVEAWAEQDPEFQEKLRRLRQLEKEIAGQTDFGT